ncbi:MAG: hypothetical protein ACLRSD_03055 [Oscillibacter sp.]
MNFFDTARAYSDSEQKVSAAFSSMRDKDRRLAGEDRRADGGGLSGRIWRPVSAR